MKTYSLSEKEISIIRSLIENDIEDLANNPSFFEETKTNPKDYINDRIECAKIFDLDYWTVAQKNCSDFIFQRLKAIYGGKTLSEFIETYEQP